MKKGLIAILVCAAFLCGCSEEYPTQVFQSTSANSSESNKAEKNNVYDGDFLLFKDIGKSYKLFNNSRITEAYLTGNTEKLSDFELEIYNAASRKLDEIKLTAKTDYEIELAVHDFIVESSTYDQQAISALGIPCENSENPYGILINHTGICLGYTTTFQLFMDMAQIPCLTVYSEDKAGDEHAWNEVEIGGDWYYVDCTWDDPVPDEDGRPAYHEYFNISEEYMDESGHRWKTEECHPTESYDYSYYVREGIRVSDEDEIKEAIKNAAKADKANVVLMTEKMFFDEFLPFIGGGKIAYPTSKIKVDGTEYFLYTLY